MYRADRDESRFTPVQRLAWDIVLPCMHIPILPEETDRVEKLIPKLQPLLDEIELLRTENQQLRETVLTLTDENRPRGK